MKPKPKKKKQEVNIVVIIPVIILVVTVITLKLGIIYEIAAGALGGLIGLFIDKRMKKNKLKKKSNSTKLLTILAILLIIFSPVALAEKANDANNEVNDPVHYSDDIDYSENDPEDLSNFDFSSLNNNKETMTRMRAMSASAPLISSAGNIALKEAPSNILNKFTPKGQFYNDLFTGSASYSYSIEVPPGVNGLIPLINLNYNSHQTALRGILGNGWSLNLNYIYRDTEYTRSNTSDDTFYLHFNGANLKLIYVASEGRYHTEYESYLYIKKEGNSWLVKTKDGTTHKFGYQSNSRLDSNIESYTSMWYLDEVEDTHNNKINYEYIKNPSSDQAIYLSKISYGANTIKFNYDFNVQNGFYYSYGTKIKQTALLNNIEVKSNDNLIRKYKFDYETTDNKKFLKKIRYIGNDGSSELPPVEFSYYQNSKGWQQNNSWKVPSDAYFGKDKDMGVRIVDVNRDGFSDIIKSYNSGNIEYWINNKNGWNSKQSWNNIISYGFVDDKGNDQGVRFLNLDSDTRIDIIQSMSGESTAKELLVNKGNGWENALSSSIILPPIPPEISFVEKKISTEKCTPDYCPSGYENKGVNCGESACTRTCLKTLCSNSESVVMDGETKYPEWNDNDYDEEDTGTGYIPEANKCYKFEFTGSSDKNNDDSECYDLYTGDYYGYDEDCDGRDLDAYAGIGFAGYSGPNSWLSTILGEDDYGFIGNVDNHYWRYKYVSKYDKDSSPDIKGKNKGDWDGFNEVICDEAGTYAIYCAPTYEACQNWNKKRCGYGCANELTSPFIVMGIYADYNNNLWDALDDNRPACARKVVDDNDYFGYGTYKVTEYNVDISYSNQECTSSQYEYKNTGVRSADVNGDGKTDIVKGTQSERKTWINKGNSFVEDLFWQIPLNAYFIDDDGKDKGVRIADVNGDGLPDLIKADGTTRTTWINTGKGWIEDNTWTIPSGAYFVFNGQDAGVILADVNGDGLPDLIKADGTTRTTWINTGKGWAQSNDWLIPEVKLNDNSATLADVNGDGLPDVVKAQDSNNRKTWINNYGKQYLLKEVRNSFGGNINIDYKKITLLDNTGNDDISDLGFNGWVVSSVTQNNGMSGNHHISSAFTYNYTGGLFNSEDREFRGFNYVEETRPSGSKVKHWFAQSDENKGIEYMTEILDKGNIYKKNEYEWTSIRKNNYYTIRMDSKKEFTYDGTTNNPKTTKTDYNYDDYGNIIKISYSGDIKKTGDEKHEYYEYIYNRDKWIIDKPRKTYLLDSNNSKVNEAHYTYNDFGDLIKEEYWLGSGDNPVVNYNYDSYGNAINITDANNHTANYEYDSTHTFITKEMNALGQETNYEYDLEGNLISVTDPNGYKTKYKYDVFGREIKEIQEYDSEESPTIEIIYEFDGVAPEKITKKLKENEQGTLDSYYFYDGFGKLIQSKTESDSQYITNDLYYDKFGRLKQESNPYYSEDEYITPDNSVPKTTYEFDVLGRITKIINPDNTKIKINYSHWTTSVYDENNNRKDYVEDAFGNIIKVKEYNNDEIYTTSYNYDAAGNLLKITDNQDNEIGYTYDTLGRKIKIEDSDLGEWKYFYDNEGNLISQIDNRGIKTEMRYDKLNRINAKKTKDVIINYVYDLNTIGVLSKIETPQLIREYEYDKRLRKISEENKIDSMTFVTDWAYDSLNRVVSKTLPDGTIIDYEYDDAGNLKRIGNVILDIKYNEFNQPTQKSYANGLKTTINYDLKNNMIAEIKTGEKQHLNYSYDDVGDIIKIHDSVNQIENIMDYDDLNRLVKAERISQNQNKIKDYSEVYTHDSIGNILKIETDDLDILFEYNGLVHSPSKIIENDKDYSTTTCNNGDTQSQSCGTGACSGGTQTKTCSNGKWSSWSSCSTSNKATSETCNNIDDDCDGLIDESLTQSCGSDIGECVSGTQTCNSGSWSSCSGSYVAPTTEICDNKDNDCDGTVDEGCNCVNGQTQQQSCGTGACSGGTQTKTCSNGKWSSWSSCSTSNKATSETCNNIDDDCDGMTDEHDISTKEGETFVYLTKMHGSDVGECKKGIEKCINGEWTVVSEEIKPQDEKCDNKDNDCNGTTDEGCDCINGQNEAQSCGTGACKEGFKIRTCSNGKWSSWSSCSTSNKATSETCNNIDDDCDGLIDENLNCGSSYCGDRICEPDKGEDQYNCWQDCTSVPKCGDNICGYLENHDNCPTDCQTKCTPVTEICDHVDNDCDGLIDEGC